MAASALGGSTNMALRESYQHLVDRRVWIFMMCHAAAFESVRPPNGHRHGDAGGLWRSRIDASRNLSVPELNRPICSISA